VTLQASFLTLLFSAGQVGSFDLDREASRFQRAKMTCGPISAYYCMKSMGMSVNVDDVVAEANLNEQGMTIGNLAELLRNHGLDARVIMVDPNQPLPFSAPTILLLKKNHCIVYEGPGANGDNVKVFEPTQRIHRDASRKELAGVWDGEAIVFGPLPLPWRSVAAWIGAGFCAMMAVLLLSRSLLQRRATVQATVPDTVPELRPAFTLIELLVVIAIIAVLAAIILPAVQNVRHRAARLGCANHLKQLGLAAQSYHLFHQKFPAGHTKSVVDQPFAYTGWATHLLPQLDQGPLWELTVKAFATNPYFFDTPPHLGMTTHLPVMTCPADHRLHGPRLAAMFAKDVSLTSYHGNSGTDHTTQDGVLYQGSAVSIATIRDGASQTLFAGERPPTPDFRYGWWYAGMGVDGRGTADMVLGVRDWHPQYINGGPCSVRPGKFKATALDNECAFLQFWSFHSGGANFAFCDGSVHFLRYTANDILPMLATRAGGDVVANFD
jgi:prepilin-type N-terminal cleavage/methylation domain-containing protein/prepilin-type processing-associated H-X9-DG protein